MVRQRLGHLGRRLALLAGVLLVGPGLALPARADERPPGSLGLIPADAAFYSAMLRNKEQIDIIARSRAWKELWDLPVVQMGWQQLRQQYSEGSLAMVRTFLEEPDNRELLDVLADAGSHEVFFYGGANWLQFVELMAMVNTAQRFGQITSLIQHKGEPDPRDQFRAVLRALAAHPELLQFPDFAMGFKITDKKRARKQIDRLEKVLTQLANVVEQLKDHVKTVKVGDDDVLTLNLDGEMVPWDQVPVKDIEEKEGEFQGLVKKLREMKLTISLGIKGDYLLFTLGASTDAISQLGGKGKRLMDRAELKPVVDALTKRLTSIGYASPAMRAQQAVSAQDVDNWMLMARQGLEAAGLPADLRKRIEKDLADLSRELLKDTPEYGAAVGFGYLTDRGFENFNYDYTKSSGLDASQPLSLLSHVGGAPILAGFARQRTSPEEYRTFVKWARILYNDAEQVLLNKLDKEQREHYEKAAKALLPLVARLDEITGKMLLPALAEGEAALVIDARWSSKRWQKSMPETPQAMPMVELALVLGVSDAALLQKAAAAYREVLSEAAAKVRELAPPGQVPEIKFPAPEKKESRQGMLYSYPLPADAGLDPQVLPTAGLSEHVLVLAPSQAMAERLLTPMSLKVEGGPLAEKRPLGAAAYFNWPALVDAVVPWVELGFAIQSPPPPPRAGAPGAAAPPAGLDDVLKQVRTVARVLKCFRGYTSATYNDGGVWVTHGESVFHDLPGGGG
jgi:hypothetical protein